MNMWKAKIFLLHTFNHSTRNKHSPLQLVTDTSQIVVAIFIFVIFIFDKKLLEEYLILVQYQEREMSIELGILAWLSASSDSRYYSQIQGETWDL